MNTSHSHPQLHWAKPLLVILGSLWFGHVACATYNGHHLSSSARSSIAPGQSLDYTNVVHNTGSDYWDSFDQPGWIYIIYARAGDMSWSPPWSSSTMYVWNDVFPNETDSDVGTLTPADLPSTPGAHFFNVYAYYPVDFFSGNYALMSSSPRRVDFTVVGPNQNPATPVNVAPANGALNQSLTLTLRSSVFSDPDAGDTHAASQWIVRRTADNVTVFDSGEDAVNQTNRTIAAGVLAHGATYGWQVRFKDNRGGWSSYSTQTTFTTIAPTLVSRRQGTNIVHTWTTNAPGFALVMTTNLATNATWSSVAPLPVIVTGQNVVTNPMAGSRKFYRLSKP